MTPIFEQAASGLQGDISAHTWWGDPGQ